MTAKEACTIIRQAYPTMKIQSCLEFDSFYAFSLASILDGSDKPILSGTTVDAVNKRNGRVFEYDMASDWKAYERAKVVKVDSIFEKPMSELDSKG